MDNADYPRRKDLEITVTFTYEEWTVIGGSLLASAAMTESHLRDVALDLQDRLGDQVMDAVFLEEQYTQGPTEP